MKNKIKSLRKKNGDTLKNFGYEAHFMGEEKKKLNEASHLKELHGLHYCRLRGLRKQALKLQLAKT